jgi:hypothetical protein
MPTRLDDNKRTLQFVFAVQAQGTLKLGMHRSLGRRQDTEIDNPRTTTPDKDQPAEITIAGDEDAALLMSNSKQLGVISLCKTKLSYRGDVMSQAAQEAYRGGIDILVGQEPHEDVARRMSSTETTSMAYWMHARMSSGAKSG